MGAERMGWQGVPAVQSVDNANYSLLTAMKYNLERIISLLDAAGMSGSGASNLLLQSLSEVNSELDGLLAAIRVEQLARIQGDEALALQIQTIVATGDGSNSTYLQSTEPTQPPYTLMIGDLWFDSDDGFKLHRWNGSAWVPVDDQRILANTAAISEEQIARIDADSALAQTIQSLTAVVNDNYTTLQGSIFEESQVRADEDEALALKVTELTATVTTNNDVITARIEDEEEARATADQAATTRMNLMQSSIDINTDGVADANARILIEETTRATADEAHVHRMETIEATNIVQGTNIASTNVRITNEVEARTNADTALGIRIDSLTATVVGDGESLDTLEARIETEEQVRAQEDQALSTRIDTVSASVIDQQTQITTVDARVTEEITVRVGADQALAQSIQTVSTTVDGHTSQITQMFNSLGGIYASYTLTVQAGGVITGIELISGGGHSDFIVKADNFRIENSSGVPFEVIGGITYIRNAIIQEAAIGTVKLQENATFDFDYAYVDYGAYSTPPVASPIWQSVDFPGGPMRATVISSSGLTQVVNLTSTVHARGVGPAGAGITLGLRVVRMNDGKVLQYFTASASTTEIANVSLEFFDESPIPNTALTYELQYIPSVNGRVFWYSTSIKGVVYKR